MSKSGILDALKRGRLREPLRCRGEPIQRTRERRVRRYRGDSEKACNLGGVHTRQLPGGIRTRRGMAPFTAHSITVLSVEAAGAPLGAVTSYLIERRPPEPIPPMQNSQKTP